ncbi:hypothetical protein BPAE_0031g00510 [Botrytis paeoniae]|uniref:Heterokaryon incompatibility domain-containing protein n=1 Tax=Botrytis paeoniae TaxID=278948 RepID=A0A4Z1FUI1_9HELO|nr:hypothetical protein BPAE_0031g00510 [Botrytis paeoniae]
MRTISSAEKRSGVDGDDDEIVDMRELGLELGTTKSDAMERLSADDICEAQERGNPEVLVEVNGKVRNEDPEIDNGSNDDPLTSNLGHYPDRDFGIESDTDKLREEVSRGNDGHENTETNVLDDSDGYNVSSGSNLDVDEYDGEVPLVEFEENEQEISDGYNPYHPGILSESETIPSIYIRWPIEYPQVAEESIESKHKTNTATGEILNPNLCIFCRVFFDTWSSVRDLLCDNDSCHILVSAHYDTMSDLKASASGGCYLCALFLGILYIDRENFSSGAHEAGNHLPLDQLKPCCINLRPKGIHRGDNHPESENVWNIWLDFWMIEDGIRSKTSADALMILDDILDSESWKRECYTNTKLGQNSRDELRLGCTGESAALAQAWLQECSSSHSAYRQEEEASVLPTRLIKIDCQETRLCISADENCSSFSEKIPYDKLCKTFRDAIDIVRVLGFSWLWVDPLCIIQGDPEDWSKEASRMAAVYGHSSLNVAATAASDGTIGCLFERDLRKIGAHKAEKLCSIADMQFYASNISSAALARHAWAVQERILASRTLHFTEFQLFWECRTKQTCEAFPDTLPEALCLDSLYLPQQEFQSWSNIISVYTNCLLTNESDRLIAIGGVARQLQKKNGDKYFAGLWQARIKEQMCWFIDECSAKVSKENTRPAPSWSWAAVKTRIYMHDDEKVPREAFIDVTNVITTLEDGDNPFGGVKSGTLELRARFMIFYERASPFEHCIKLSVGKFSIVSVHVHWDYEDCGPKDSCNSILILPIGILSDTGMDPNPPTIEGLLLRHTDQENGQYDRLGHFTILQKYPNYELICRAMNLAQYEQFGELGLGDALPSEKDYISTGVDEDGITWYTISIV